jgi:UDP-N-acetylglucosamine 4,6-dehydratase
VTGGTGSLGKAILRHQDFLKENKISRIRVLSRDEIKQDAIEKVYKGDIELQCILADVRSKDRLAMALDGVHYLIHAAALKIVNKIEYDVPEVSRTNVSGTENVLQVFLKQPTAIAGLFVSTDKAVDPVNAYGFSKAFAERIWLWGMMIQNNVKLSVCRYGNVFGSRGSVIDVWTQQAKQGLPLSLTHEEMTRFFISLKGASKFVLENLFDCKGGEICLPAMGSTAMRNLGEVIFRHWNPGENATFETVGIREGEKIHEALTGVNDLAYFCDQTNPREIPPMFLRPLTPKVQCYLDQKRTKIKLDRVISSHTAPSFSTSELTTIYTNWLGEHG